MAQPLVSNVMDAAVKVMPSFFKNWYINKLGGRMAKFGLHYHDIVAEGPIVAKAMSRLPEDLALARKRRMRRGLDMSLKHVELSEVTQTSPWDSYKETQELLEETQFLEDERAAYSDKLWLTAGTRNKWFEYDTSKAWFLK